MAPFIPYLLIAVLLSMAIIGTLTKNASRHAFPTWLIVFGFVGCIAVLRAWQFINDFQLWLLYGGMVVVNYFLTFSAAYLFYRDPADNPLPKLAHKIKVHYSIPVFNEKGDLRPCVESILRAARAANDIAEVEIAIINDGSTDDTGERLKQFENMPGITVWHLSQNAGKKGAITIGTYGGENWRDGFELFASRFGREPTNEDDAHLVQCLREVGCNPTTADILMHTDSDSYIDENFIRLAVIGMLSDPQIGAISGHCQVWLESDEKPTFITLMQVAWYDRQCRIRKGAESAGNAVFCVVGPGAVFRRLAVFHKLRRWVDDFFLWNPRARTRRRWNGTTDRMITYMTLEDGWKVLYSYKATVWTKVPETLPQLRRQWTRWKQNFWRIFMLIWRFAWRTHPLVAYLTYSRLLVTVLAPFVLSYHLILLLLGEYYISMLYLAGIAMMGGLFGISYTIDNPKKWRLGLLRPVISLFSALWGSMLTLRAFFLTFSGQFTWRETLLPQIKGRFINRWFTPTFELRLIEVVIMIALCIAIILYYLAH